MTNGDSRGDTAPSTLPVSQRTVIVQADQQRTPIRTATGTNENGKPTKSNLAASQPLEQIHHLPIPHIRHRLIRVVLLTTFTPELLHYINTRALPSPKLRCHTSLILGISFIQVYQEHRKPSTTQYSFFVLPTTAARHSTNNCKTLENGRGSSRATWELRHFPKNCRSRHSPK